MPTANELLQSPIGPAAGVVSITPSDSVGLAQVTRALYVGSAGTIVCVMADDSVGMFVGAQAGTMLALRIKRVNATGTTAASLLGLY